MIRLRQAASVLLSLALFATPLWSAPSSVLGTVVYADRARVGAAAASVGATVFGGDKLTTDVTGSVQVRAGAARLLLNGSTVATLSKDEEVPAATLTYGSATFSTANSKAFALRFANAVIRPNTDGPTVGSVTVVGTHMLIVRSTRGSLNFTVDDDSRVIPEGMAYRVDLDPAAQGPAGAGTKGMGGPPIRAGKSRFMWYAIGITAIATAIAIHEALESPDKP